MRPSIPLIAYRRYPTNFSLTTYLLSLLFLTTLPSTTHALEHTVIVTISQATTTTATEKVIATPQVPQDPSYTSQPLFQSSVLDASNAYRTVHNASNLSWNKTLADFASKWAETCLWEHSGGPYGENLAYGYNNATAAVAAWGDEVSMYDFSKPTGFTEETGHFTQLVWKGTREVGCAAVDCGLTNLDRDDEDESEEGGNRAQGWYVVCEYVPGGNVVGAKDDLELFRLNVQEGDGDIDLGGGDGEDEEDAREDEDECEDGDEDKDRDQDEDDHEDRDEDRSEMSREEEIAFIIRGGSGLLRPRIRGIGWCVGIVYVLSSV